MLWTTFNIALMVLGFGLLIFVHELGHFLAAKWAGIRAEAFAIGMGPVVCAWRKGIGFRFGSTVPEYRRRAIESMDAQSQASREAIVSPSEVARRADAIGLGETEYSLRWLPIGGFVKMLGQDDSDPTAVSDDPRSYTQRPIGKRMVVVAAGVVMNLILAVILFIIAFMAGVKFNAPVIGEVQPGMPAATARAVDADFVGTQPGDRLVSIDGKPARTFADLQVAAAMGKPGQALNIVVDREGVSSPIHFSITPQRNDATRLLGIGVLPEFTTTLLSSPAAEVRTQLVRLDLAEQGVEPGMTLLTVQGQPVKLQHEVNAVVGRLSEPRIATTWVHLNKSGEPVGPVIQANANAAPQLTAMISADARDQREMGLLGFVPLVRVIAVDKRNADVLREDDVILKAGSIHGPRMQQFMNAVQGVDAGTMSLTVLRDGSAVDVEASVKGGRLGIEIAYAFDSPYSAEPITSIVDSTDQATPTAAAQLDLRGVGPARIVSINDQAINDWTDFYTALRRVATSESGEDVPSATITYVPGIRGAEPFTQQITLTADEVVGFQDAQWVAGLPPSLFEELYVVRDAQGNPLRAVGMGVEETWKMVVMTYLTIDRLIRRSVGVEQIRGPVGIVHLGTQLLDKGFMYLVFLLAAISVNLAVINFLPLPIVDGGLFLFLVYEKLRGRPPSIAFQNAAALVGLCLIVTVLLVVTWNDVMRLIS